MVSGEGDLAGFFVFSLRDPEKNMGLEVLMGACLLDWGELLIFDRDVMFTCTQDNLKSLVNYTQMAQHM